MHSFIAIFLVALAAIFPGLYAAKLKNILEPKGDLGITLDYSLATSWDAGKNAKGKDLNSWLFSSHLIFKYSVDDIKDEQLWQISKDAITEMDASVDQYMIPKDQRPNAMGIMAWGNEIILTSSQRIGPPYSYTTGVESAAKDYTEQDVVLKSLKLCQVAGKSSSGYDLTKEHTNEGKCVEPMSANMYYILQKPAEGRSGDSNDQDYDDDQDEDYRKRVPLKDQKPRIAVWTHQQKTDEDTKKRYKVWEQTPPCQKAGKNEGVSNCLSLAEKSAF